MKRREFLASAALAAGVYKTSSMVRPATVRTSLRPPSAQRCFVSVAVEKQIHDISAKIADPELAWMFQNCFPNPLDTTVEFSMAGGKPDTFVITGDIPAMWLRDSMYQMWPYLPLARHDAHLQTMIRGVIARMADCVLISPYAEAFLKSVTATSPWRSDHTHMAPGVWEHKWEVDSLCAVIRLSHGYWQATGDITPFNSNWRKAMDRIVETFHIQQRLDGPGPYRFQRAAWNSTDTLPRNGLGFPAKPVGLIYTMFRPSDDAGIYPLHIPDNLLAAVSLNQLATMYQTLGVAADHIVACNRFANTLHHLAKAHGIRQHPQLGLVYAYEVDGFGNAVFMDDANWPSVLSLPYLGLCPANDPVYQASRALVWGPHNPYFYKGQFEGIGSIHTPDESVWPMSLIMYGLTATTPEQVAWALRQLKLSSAGTGFIHESINKNDPKKFTRSWFAMANAMFGELVVQTATRYPQVLQQRL
ncbi:MAG: glycoside hydrolase family 125 protein [Phycisphaerae bacterium]